MLVEFKNAFNSQEMSIFKEISRSIFPVTYTEEFYNSMVIRNGYHAILIVLPDAIVGVLSFEAEKQVIYIFTFGIIQKYRGIGLGDQSWKKAEGIFRREFNCNRIVLHTQVSNLKALDFYTRRGFTIKETVFDYYEGLQCNSAYTLEKSVD